MFGLLRHRGRGQDAWKQWRLHYCGTCKTMGRIYGQGSRFLLNHDTVYLAEVLGANIEWSAPYRSFNCMSMPATASDAPDILRFAAAATVALAEYKLRDQEEDSGFVAWRWARRLWRRPFRIAVRELQRLQFDVAALDRALSGQRAAEANPVSLAQLADPTASAVAMFFAHGRPDLAEFGRQLGFLVYVLDAVEDFSRDAAAGSFNALAALGMTRAQGIAVVDQAAVEAVALLRQVDLALSATFASRLRANLDPRLGRTLPVCMAVPARFSWSAAWDRAEDLAVGRAWPVVAAVAMSVFIFPAHGRMVEDADQCLSLGANLMAVGSLFAVAIGKRGPKAAGGAPSSSGCGGDCCDGCCMADACGECACDGCCECGSCDC